MKQVIAEVKLSPAHIRERILDFRYLMVLALLSLSIGTGLYIHFGPQIAQLEANSQQTPPVSLVQLLERHTSDHGGRPALIMAASGGGTRAALYTASVLEGLARQGRIKNFILGSGVSGGEAALAYFAGKRKEIVDDEKNGWDEYFNAMRQPFIQDVINVGHVLAQGRKRLDLSKSSGAIQFSRALKHAEFDRRFRWITIYDSVDWADFVYYGGLDFIEAPDWG